MPFDDFVLITRPLRGTFGVRSSAEGLVQTRKEPRVMDAYGSYQLRWRDNCQVLNMVLDRHKLERIAAELRGLDAPMPVRFALGAPSSPKTAKAWASVTRFVYDQTGPSAKAEFGPLAGGQLFRLTVAALLDAYPSTFCGGEAPPAGAVSPAALRRAKAFIELRAADDIGLPDIAAAARLSVRGLQAAFQRHEQTTPLAYLREARLRGAHAELRAAHPQETTVAAVASRWGFANLGRFAAEHRKQFGSSPSQTLANL